MLNFYPAIDLKEGQCVRLLCGDMDQSTVFSDEPAMQAKDFIDQGANWLHIVDLDGAFEGKSVNQDAIISIISYAKKKAKIQLGGGIRNLKHMEFWLEQGLDRLILGTIALKNPDLVKEACREFEGHIAVGIDARDGYVATEGWADLSQMKALDLAKIFQNEGVSAIIHTDISRDGAMMGPNMEASFELAEEAKIPVIISGGVSNLDDVRAIKKQANSYIDGVISGRALYDGKIHMKEALEILEQA